MIIEDLNIQGPNGDNKDYLISCKVIFANQSELVFVNESILEIWKNLSEEKRMLFVRSFMNQILEAKLGQS